MGLAVRWWRLRLDSRQPAPFVQACVFNRAVKQPATAVDEADHRSLTASLTGLTSLRFESDPQE